MTRSTAKKATTKKAAAKKADEPKAPEPMDAAVREQTTPDPLPISKRDARALTTLAAEVTDLFPEVTYETSNPNGFGTALSVDFDPNGNDGADLYPLLSLVESDPRVLAVEETSPGHVTVTLHSSLRTQDSRDSFGLADAYAILSEEYEQTVFRSAVSGQFVTEEVAEEHPDTTVEETIVHEAEVTE